MHDFILKVSKMFFQNWTAIKWIPRIMSESGIGATKRQQVDEEL